MIRFGRLESRAERLLWKTIELGTLVDLRAGDPDADAPAGGAGWADKRAVRSELIVELATTERRPNGRPPRVLRCCGGRISGELNLEAMTLRCPLVFEDCYFERGITLNEARVPSIRLTGSSVPWIRARQVDVVGDVALAGVTGGTLDLEGARVGGGVSMQGATFGVGDDAYVIDGAILEP